MCFFVAQFAKLSQMRTRYWNSVLKDEEYFSEHFIANAFNHPNLLILSEQDESPTLHLARWGLVPSWVKTEQEAVSLADSTLNARGETIFDKPSFAHSARQSRCIIPVNGFFEWQHLGDRKQPYYISLKDQEIFSLAGLYSEWNDSTSMTLCSTFSIITVEANPLLSVIHNSKQRMPLILEKEDEREWLSHSTATERVKEMLTTYPDTTMQAWQVSPLNPSNPKANSPNAIKPSTLF